MGAPLALQLVTERSANRVSSEEAGDAISSRIEIRVEVGRDYPDAPELVELAEHALTQLHIAVRASIERGHQIPF